jgi:hypothetical protein
MISAIGPGLNGIGEYTMRTKMKLTAGVALLLVMGAPVAASAQDSSQYDGYCYAKESDAKQNGMIIGAIAGGLVGSQVSKNERGLGAVAGAVAGGALGRQIGKSSVKCLNGEYYSYQNGAYSPAAAPDGYVPVYYKSRPDSTVYQTVYYNADGPNARSGYANNGYSGGYNNGGYASDSGYAPSNARQGYRDDQGAWHAGRPVAFGWKDERGQWHEGRVEAYGWQDSAGRWHQSPGNNSGYGSN